MTKDLKVYNHLNYKSEAPSEHDGFVEFLFEHAEIEIPDVNEENAWESLNQKIYAPKKQSFSWMKIAATVTILAILSATLYLFNPSPSTINVVSTNEKVDVLFPDGSIGILNENSSVEYPEIFDDERNVSLNGEAYFDIKKSEKPFIIDVNGVDVKVLGTAFNLITNGKEVRLYVDRGLVAFEKSGQQTKVPAGKEAIFDKKTSKVEIKDVAASNIMSWRNGVFVFDNTPLSQATKELSDYYDVEFEFANGSLRDCKITVTFKNQSLKKVLETISTALSVKTNIKNNKVKISGPGC